MKTRYHTLDALRGFALVNMIAYHALWDIVYLFNYDIDWFELSWTHIWQQLICCTFILISGFSFSFSKNKLKRGLIVFSLGLLITLVTTTLIPNASIIFGILTLIGSCMLICTPIYKIFDKCNPYIGTIIALLLFIICKNVNEGYLGFEGINIYKLPTYLYKNLFTAYLGFPNKSFYSSDYFSLIPWLFLFIAGYFIKKIFEEKGLLSKLIPHKNLVLEYLGERSLLIYVVHQPLIYLILLMFC